MMVNSKQMLNQYIAQDAILAGIRNDFKHRIVHFFCPVYTFEYIRTLRKACFYNKSHNLLKKLWGVILTIKCHHMSLKLGFYIPNDVFGCGVYIPHYGSVIINPNTKIGNNCQINNNVVIGQVKGHCPIIGNNVFIGSGSVICGNIHIPDNVWIGANSVVTKDIKESNVLVAGCPAKIVCRKEKNWVEQYNLI